MVEENAHFSQNKGNKKAFLFSQESLKIFIAYFLLPGY
jgi:hypothetical protein